MQMNTSYIYRTGTALLLLLAAAAGAPAQERWSLKQCIDHAIANNITIRQTANQAEQSRVDVNTAKWARLPSLNGSAGQSWSWGRSQTAVADEETGEYNTVYVNTKNNNTSFSLSTGIPLFTGLQLPNQYALAKLNLKASLADLAKAKEDIAINIASLYLQVLFNIELHDVALGQADLSREQLKRIEALAREGKAAPAEVAENQAALMALDGGDGKMRHVGIGERVGDVDFPGEATESRAQHDGYTGAQTGAGAQPVSGFLDSF